MKKIILSMMVVAATVTLGFAQTTSKMMSDTGKSYVRYAMSHPLHDWEGTSKSVKGVIVVDNKTKEITQTAIAIKVSTFDSQNANRDSHMMEATDAIKFPNVTFASTSFQKDPQGQETVTGNLSFHGISHSITVPIVEKTDSNGEMEVTGKFDVKMTDYKIDPPSLLGMPAKDDIKLNFDLFFK
jgi:polyisoprenoid-binding protein YceI